MTLGIAWLRAVGDVRELVVASDSRLSGGQHWDANAKIMMLPRTDAVISFAGATADAYPLMLQAFNSILMHPPAANRSMDISALRGHLVRVFNHCRKFISGLPNGQKMPDKADADFLLAGYDWRLKSFKIWKLHYKPSISEFTYQTPSGWNSNSRNLLKQISYVGDKEVVKEARKRVFELLSTRSKLPNGTFDMEPFEVMRDLLREGSFKGIGGAIQLVKIYEHSNVAPFAVYWPTKNEGTVCVMGRPLMDFEKCPWGTIDPDSPSKATTSSEIIG